MPMRFENLVSSGAALLLILPNGACERRAASAPTSNDRENNMQIEIVPSVSIGPLRLGTSQRELPDGVTLQHEAGSFDGIHFLLEDDVVQEIWIDDLRTLPHELTYKGQAVDRQSTVAKLEEIFGPCSGAEEVMGGRRIACASGVQLGIGAVGDTVQIRIRR